MCYIGASLIGKRIESVSYVHIITLKKLAKEFGWKELILLVKWKKYSIINIEASNKVKPDFSYLKLHWVEKLAYSPFCSLSLSF